MRLRDYVITWLRDGVHVIVLETVSVNQNVGQIKLTVTFLQKLVREFFLQLPLVLHNMAAPLESNTQNVHNHICRSDRLLTDGII